MSRCDQVNAFLSSFGSYKAKDKSRIAYEIKAGDKIDYCAGYFNSLQTEKGEIDFYKSPGAEVEIGDFIEIIQWPHLAVHWSRDVFIAQNINPTDNVIIRGNAVLEQSSESHLTTAGTVIKVGTRYFIEIKNGRVMTNASQIS